MAGPRGLRREPGGRPEKPQRATRRARPLLRPTQGRGGSQAPEGRGPRNLLLHPRRHGRRGSPSGVTSSSTARRLRASVIGVAWRERYDSTAWTRASTPLAAVTKGGQGTESSGSTRATAGTNESSRMLALKPRVRSRGRRCSSSRSPCRWWSGRRSSRGPGSRASGRYERRTSAPLRGRARRRPWRRPSRCRRPARWRRRLARAEGPGGSGTP